MVVVIFEILIDLKYYSNIFTNTIKQINFKYKSSDLFKI